MSNAAAEQTAGTAVLKTGHEGYPGPDLRLEFSRGELTTDSDKWEHGAYKVRVFKGDREILTTDYRMGTGHFDLRAFKGLPLKARQRINAKCQTLWGVGNWENALNQQDRTLHAEKVRREFLHSMVRLVCPDPADVVGSLISDGFGALQSSGFDDWAGNYGYDTDSRKAEGIFRLCSEIGLKLQAHFGTALTDPCYDWACQR